MTDSDPDLALARSLQKAMSEPAEQTKDINILAAASRITLAKPNIPPPEEPAPKKNGTTDFKAMVGHSFVKRTPGIYVGATYEVKSCDGDQFLVARNDPAHGIFEFTMKCERFHELMEPPKAQPVKPPPPVTKPKPASPWAEKK